MQQHYFTDLDTNEVVYLPTPPPSWEVNISAKTTTEEVLGFGEVITGSYCKLATYSIETIFPTINLGFIAESDFRTPDWLIIKFETWTRNSTLLRYRITETNVSFECIITNFKYGQDDMSGDTKVEITIEQSCRIILNQKGNIMYADLWGNGATHDGTSTENKTSTDLSQPTGTSTGTTAAATNTNNSTASTTNKKYTVKSGDNLYNIAKAQYGDSSKWRELYNKNKNIISNPNLIYPGQVLTL